MSCGPGSVLVAPAAGRPGCHVRSTRNAGPKGDRRRADLLHAFPNDPHVGTAACGAGSHGLFWFGRVPFDPTAPGGCLDCVQVLTIAA